MGRKGGRSKRVHLDLGLGRTIGRASTIAYHPQRAGRKLSRMVLGGGRFPKVKSPLRHTRFGILRGR